MANTKIIDFEIRRMIDTKELTEALTYISECYAQKLNITPAPPSELLVAYRNTEIVGTFGINVADLVHPLRLTEIYKFDSARIPFPATSELSVEFCRWISGSRLISAALILAAIRLSVSMGKRYVWCEHTLAVNRAARLFGINFYVIKDAIIDLDRVEDIYKNYYQNAPGLFVFELNQAENAPVSYLLRNSSN